MWTRSIHRPAAISDASAVQKGSRRCSHPPRRSGAGRVPVFWQRPEYLVLPSFGSMTGGAEVAVELGDQLFAAGPERVIPLPIVVP